MTTARSTHYKLGIFALVALGALVLAALALGISLRKPTVSYHTYFDESVQGLDLGSPVKFRGVTIGTVAAIDIAPDHKLIDVTLALDTRRTGAFDVSEGMRAQLAGRGITGVKFVEIDLTDPALHPPPELEFDPPERYIPSRASLMKDLQGHLEAIAPRVRAMVERAVVALDKVDAIIDTVRERGVVDKIAGAAAKLERVAGGLDRANLGPRVAKVVDEVQAAIAGVTRVTDRFDGNGGMVATAQRAIDSIADIGRGLGASELEQTIHDLGDAARAVRDLAEAIERQPDMLLKGRARTSKR